MDQKAGKLRLNKAMAPVPVGSARTNTRTDKRGDSGLETGVIGSIGASIIATIDQLAGRACKVLIGLDEEGLPVKVRAHLLEIISISKGPPIMFGLPATRASCHDSRRITETR